jgi:DNA-binding NtrC family response regulator
MHIDGPIVIIDDDADDQEILKLAFSNLGYKNPVSYFIQPSEALTFLQREEVLPFIILSGIHMNKVNGFDLKKTIMEDKRLKLKCSPFIFYGNGSTPHEVRRAYCESVQGIFSKADSLESIQQTIKTIIDYWRIAVEPDNPKSTLTNN